MVYNINLLDLQMSANLVTNTKFLNYLIVFEYNIYFSSIEKILGMWAIFTKNVPTYPDFDRSLVLALFYLLISMSSISVGYYFMPCFV